MRLVYLDNKYRVIGLIIILLAITLLAGCQSDKEDVIVIDLTEEEMAQIVTEVKPIINDAKPIIPIEQRLEAFRLGMVLSSEVRENSTLLNIFQRNELFKRLELVLLEDEKSVLDGFDEGTIDGVLAPIDKSARFFNSSDGQLSIMSVQTDSTLMILSTKGMIEDIGDLAGKQVYYNSKIIPAKEIVQTVLKRKQIKLNSKIQWIDVESEAALINKIVDGSADVAITSSEVAYIIMNRTDSVDISINLSDLWTEGTKTQLLPIRGILVRNDIDPVKIKQLEVLLNNANSPVTWERAKIYQKDIQNYLRVLTRINPDVIGGELPDEKLFYNWTITQ